jgi:chromosome segregation ATPase
MKKIIIAALALTLLLGATSAKALTPADNAGLERPVQEQIGVPKTFGERFAAWREETAQDLETKRQEISALIDAKKTAVENAFNGERIAGGLQAKITERFDALYERLTKISDRLQSRINTMKAAGGNVTEAQSHLDQARSALATAEMKASTISLSEISDGESLKANLESIKEVKDAFKQVQLHLTLSVRAIKSANANINASVNPSKTKANTGATQK